MPKLRRKARAGNETWITVMEAARRLGVSRGKVYVAIARREYRSVMLLGKPVVSRADVDREAARRARANGGSAA